MSSENFGKNISGLDAISRYLGLSFTTTQRYVASKQIPCRRVGNVVVSNTYALDLWVMGLEIEEIKKTLMSTLEPSTPAATSSPSTPPSAPAPIKRGRGRPRKNPLPSTPLPSTLAQEA